MPEQMLRWAPAILLALGAVAGSVTKAQRTIPLEQPLAASVAPQIVGLAAGDELELPERERLVAGVDSYLLRAYRASDAPNAASLSLYVGYYERQRQGHTIHSPKNCLPGAGWEALASTTHTIRTSVGDVRVSRTLLQRDKERAVVLYWYQGRGRIQSNEYAVKWNLFLDSALRRRSDEALVRIVAPVQHSEEASLALASAFAGDLIPQLSNSLPQ